MVDWTESFSNSLFLLFLIGIPLYGALKKIAVFDVFIEGAREGFTTCVRLIPYLVAMLMAIGMLRASGFFTLLSRVLDPLLHYLGMPSELLPLALIRPFSGAAATGLTAELIKENGGDAFISKLAATMMGSTETTFYVIAVYFGVVGIQKTRYAIPAGLLADLAGIIASVIVCRYLFL
ncbi:MAG: spore maturation protein [Legionellaceae bacterium]|nr:spore maturation protein [Legionellaceae bacterium]